MGSLSVCPTTTTSNSEADGVFTIRIRKTKTETPHSEVEDRGGVPRTKPHVTAIKNDKMGFGSEELGKILLTAFVNTIRETSPLPGTIVFYNHGIHLAVEGSPVIDSLRELQSRGVSVAVISASKNASHILKRIGLLDRLDGLVSGHDIPKGRGKPNPDVFLKAAEILGKDPAASVVFEDAVLGVEAGKRAKMVCIGIDRYGKPERLNKADLVISDIGEITIDIIEKLVEKRGP